MTLVAAGLVLVAVDFRTRSVDFLPDIVGWVLVAVGVKFAGVTAAARLASAAAVLSVTELALPYHVIRLDPATGAVVPADRPSAEHLPHQVRWDDLPILRGALIGAAAVVGAVALACLLLRLADRAAQLGDHGHARMLRTATLAVPMLSAGPIAVLMLVTWADRRRYDPVWDDAAGRFGLLGILSLLVLADLLFMRRNTRWARSDHNLTPSHASPPSV
jgi:hypothetical protein